MPTYAEARADLEELMSRTARGSIPAAELKTAVLAIFDAYDVDEIDAAVAAAETAAEEAVLAAGFRWQYSTTTTMADPGVGRIRLNSATLNAVTAIAFDDQSYDTGNPNVSARVVSWGQSTNAVKGALTLRKGTAWAEYQITAMTDNSGWTQFTVQHVGSSGAFANNDVLVVDFSRAGDGGAVTSFQSRTGAVALLASDVTAALGTQPAIIKSASDVLRGEEGVAFDFLSRTAFINDYADTLSNSGRPHDLLTVDRNSIGTFVDRDRLIKSAANNVLRYDHDPITGAPLGALIEAAITNRLLRSQEFDNAAWTKNDVTITADAVVAPDGTTTADTLTENSATATHQVQQSAAISAGQTLTLSVWVKAGSGSRWVVLLLAGASGTAFAHFNPGDGSAGDVGVTGGYTSASARAEQYPNGWWRFSLSCVTVTDTSVAAQIRTKVTNGGVSSYAGDGASSTHLWGAQLEALLWPTSYIPTTSATVQRSGDNVTLATTLFKYNALQGTLLCDVSVPRIVTSTVGALSLSDGGVNERIALMLRFSNVSQMTINQGGVAQVATDLSADSPAAGAVRRLAMAWRADDVAGSVNGSAVVTDTSAVLPTVNTLRLGTGGGSTGQISGHLRRAAYISRRMTNAELQALTA